MKLTSTTMSMSLDLLRKQGYFAEPVEHSPRIPGRPDLTIKRDLLGFADIIALREHVLLVQTTSAANMRARMKKIQCCKSFDPCKRAGVLVHVHGWGEGGLRVVNMTAKDAEGNFIYATLWDSILRAGPRSRKRPRTQTMLAL